MSMKPGQTILPEASISVRAESGASPTATIFRPTTPRSLVKRGRPVPSTIVPPRIFRSYAAGLPGGVVITNLNSPSQIFRIDSEAVSAALRRISSCGGVVLHHAAVRRQRTSIRG